MPKSWKPDEKGEGFIELALVLVLVAIVLIVILALLGPQIITALENFVGIDG